MNIKSIQRLAVVAAALALSGSAIQPAQAAVSKTATRSWTGDAGQTVTIGNATGACNGCTRYSLTKVSGDTALQFTVHHKRSVGSDGKRYAVTTFSTTSATAGVYVIALTFRPGKSGRPAFTTTWTLTFQGPPSLHLPAQSYLLAQSGGTMTVQDVKVETNSPGARTYSVLSDGNTAGCALPSGSTRVTFTGVGHCTVRVSLAASGIFTAATEDAIIMVNPNYSYGVTVRGWVQRTRSTANDAALSRARARAVRSYLVSQGVNVSHFSMVQGMGVYNSSNAARRATVRISWTGLTAGSRTTTVYFAPMSSRLTTSGKAALRALWAAVPKA